MIIYDLNVRKKDQQNHTSGNTIKKQKDMFSNLLWMCARTVLTILSKNVVLISRYFQMLRHAIEYTVSWYEGKMAQHTSKGKMAQYEGKIAQVAEIWL